MADENVVNYEGKKISLYTPKSSGKRDIAYVRPGDEIHLNFDIRDASALKVEVIKGDLHIVFSNGSTLTLVSMAAIGFSDNSPKIITLDGRTLSLEEFLSITEVLNYNEALLILANENHTEHSNDEPKLIQVSSDQEADNEAGIPITGQGTSDILSKGVPSDVIDTTGTVEKQETSVSHAPFVSTIWTTNYPYTLDKTNYLPGDAKEKNQPNLKVTVLYGSQLSNKGTTHVGNKDYTTYSYENGFTYTDDSFSQLDPNQVHEEGSNKNIFVNNSSVNMKYIFNMNYTKGLFPSYMEIVVPKIEQDIVKLSEFSGMTFSNITSTNDGMVYAISEINPIGIMQFLMSFPTNTQISNFDLSYNIKYLDPSSGEFLTATSTTSLSLYPVSQESNLDKTQGFVLSTVPNPVYVVTGSGDDIIVGGGGNNTIRSGAGNDKVFTYSGNDIVNVGSGDNEVWGSQGSDIIEAGSNGKVDGHNKLYYDNRKTDIDPTGISFKDYYYNTNTASAGVFVYYGFNGKSLKGFAGDGFINASNIKDTDLVIKKSQGSDIIRGFQDIYLSQYNDNLIISDAVNLGNLRIHGGDLTNGRTDIDIVSIDDSFVGAMIKIGADSTVHKGDGSALVTFTNFEVIKGSKNDDIFYGGIISGFSGSAVSISLDGMGGYDILSYENLADGYAIVFNANTGIVQKNNNAGTGFGADSIKNFEEITASKGADVFYGSFSNNYVYSNLGADDLVSYEKSNAPVTLVLDGKDDLNIYKTSSFIAYTDLEKDSGIYRDILKGSLDLNKGLKLSNKNDIVIVTDEAKSYNINAGLGKDTLSYADLKNGIKVVFDNSGVGSVTKSGGGIDKFDVLIGTGNDASVNIYNIIGTAGDDIFEMGDGDGNRSGFSLNGREGVNTLSYANVSKDSKGFGVNFVFSGGGNSTVTRVATSITDYFTNFQKFIGSDFNDNVFFSSSTTLAEIKGLTFDLGEGEDTVSFVSLKSTEADHIDISFEGKSMKVSYYKGETSVGSSEFINTEGVYGTAGDDIFRAVSGMNLFFDGSYGLDTADYSAISDDIQFNLFQKTVGNVKKGSNTDTLLNVEHIKGGTGVNTYYLDSAVSYIIDGNGKSNIVSYHNATSAITYNVSKNIVTKGSGANKQTDTLNKVDAIKGSTWNDIFVIDYNMTNPLPSYSLYGNDIYGDGSGHMINPSNDTDMIDLTSFTVAIDLVLDSSKDGSYSVYDSNGKITKEGHVDISIPISSGKINLQMYHIEGFIAGSGNDSFELISSYEAAMGRTKWFIDGGAGTNTVSYANDANLSNIQPNGTHANVIQVNLSNLGATVARYYNNASGQTARVEDTLKNIQTLILSKFDDVVNINTGWANSGITKIDAGEGNDTLSFLGITEEITVDFDNAGAFTAKIVGNTGTLPTFTNFENIRLSSGKSTVHFKNGSNFSSKVSITGSNNSKAEAILDFSDMSSAVTITLSQDRDGFDNIAGAMKADVTFISSFPHNGFTLLLADYNNIIHGSSQKSMNFKSFDGKGTGNTLDYGNVTTLGVKIHLSQSGGEVIKNNNDLIYDTFDNSFSTINGTTKADTVWITDLKLNFTSKHINLGGQEGDNVLIDIKGGVTYNINNSTASAGGTNLNISGIEGVDTINFGAGNDTIVFSAEFGSNNSPMSYAKYNGGEGTNSLDFSALQNIIFDANTQKISKDPTNTAYASINWSKGKDHSGASIDLVFQRFYTITAAATTTVFYGQARNNYNFIGGSGNDTINYTHSASNVYIYLLDLKVQKNNDVSTVDTFNDKIDTIIGSNSNDTLMIDKISTANTNMSVDGAGGNNTVNFNFNQASGTHVDVVFSSTGNTTFDLVKGGNTTTIKINLKNFQSYIFTENDDRITVDTSLPGSNNFNGGLGIDTIIYTGADNIIYDSTRSQVTRGSDGKIIDNINNIEIISYQGGKGKATFFGSETSNKTYLGDSTRTTWDTDKYSDAVIDYSGQSPSAAIRVDFTLKDNLMTITKGSSEGVDYFNSYITKIIGTKGDDVFVLANRDTKLPSIKLEGGGGNDRVSFANYSGSGAEFEVNTSGQVAIKNGSTGFSGYIIDSNTIKGFELTQGNDIFYGNLTSQLDIDGGKGIDILNYSSLNNVNITIDFSGVIGTVQKNDTVNHHYYIDKFKNFEGVVTGDGDDTIIIADNVISNNSTGSFDAGGGTNVLNATRITYDMNVTYGGAKTEDQFKANVAYSKGSNTASGTYSGFQQISLGKGANHVTYYHDAKYESLHLRFASNIGSSDTFTLTGSVNKTFFIDNVTDVNNFVFSTTSAGSSFMEVFGFANIIAKDTTYALNIKASGLAMNHIFWGGTTAGDEINYSNSISGLTASVKTDSNNNKYIEIKGKGTNTFTDQLYNIETITLSDEDDVFEIDDIKGYGNGNITIDAGGGVNNTLSLAKLSTGVTASIGANGELNIQGGTQSNILLKHFQTTSLTDHDDIVIFREDTSTIVNGNKGTDTADYKTNTFTKGVTLTVIKDINGNVVMDVNKKATSKDDLLQNFNIFNLTDNDDEFVYSGKLSFGADPVIIDMLKGNNTVDFSAMDTSIADTKFLYDTKGVLSITNSTAGINYQIKNMNLVILGGTNSSLVIQNIPSGQSPVTFDGGKATNVSILDLTQLNNGENLIADLFNESIHNGDNSLKLSYVNFRGITGSAKIITYNMATINQHNEIISYKITTNNTHATISYNNSGVIGGIKVEIDGDNATVTSDSGVVSTITGGFSKFEGSTDNDTFTFKSNWKDGLEVDSAAKNTEGQDVLDLSKLSSAVSYKIDLAVTTGDKATIDTDKKATFRNFANITGTQARDEFIVSLTGIARNYTGVTLTSGGGLDTFTTTGSNLGGKSAVATVAVANNSIVSFSAFVNNFSVAISLIDFGTLQFNADMDVNLSFTEYKNSKITHIVGNNDRNNTLDISASSSHVSIVKNNNNMEFLLTEGADNKVLVTLDGFKSLILGNKQDIIILKTTDININGGGSTASSPDTVYLGFDNLSVYATKNMIQVYSSATPNFGSDAHSQLENFSVISSQSKGNFTVLDNAQLNYLKSIELGNNSVFYLKANDGKSASVSEAKLTIDTTNIMQINSASFTIKGFSEFHFGNGNDQVIYDTSSDFTGSMYGEGGANTLVIKGSAALNIHFGQQLSVKNLKLFDFYNVDVSAVSNSVEKKITFGEDTIAGKSYNLNGLNKLEVDPKFFKDNNINSMIIDKSLLQIFSPNGSSITAQFANNESPVFSTNLSEAIHDNFILKYIHLPNNLQSSSNREISTIPVDKGAGFKRILDLTNLSSSDGQHSSYNFNYSGYDLIIADTKVMFNEMDEVSFGNYQTIMTYQQGTSFNGNITFYGGGASNDTVKGMDGLTLKNGHIVIYTGYTFTHTYQGFEIFSNFSSINLTGEEDNLQSQNASLGKDHEYNTSAEHYSMTNGDNTLIISGFKNHNIVDMKGGEDAIVLNGLAASYNVEYFKDSYINVDGKQYSTGGNYLVITDTKGHQMYIFNANLDDIKAGGIFKNGEEGSDSSHTHLQSNYDVSLSLDSSYSDGHDGVSQYGRVLHHNPQKHIVQDTHDKDSSQHTVNEDSSHNLGKLPFELVESDSLGLQHCDDEFNIDNANQVINIGENSNDIHTNNKDISESLDSFIEQVGFNHNQDQNNKHNHNISENDLRDVLDQTFINENDDLNSFNININSKSNGKSNNKIDVTSINENLVEETILQEKDIDGYKLETERNEDGTLKIHHNSNNGNL